MYDGPLNASSMLSGTMIGVQKAIIRRAAPYDNSIAQALLNWSVVCTGTIARVELWARSMLLKCGASTSPVSNITSESMLDATMGEQIPVALSCA